MDDHPTPFEALKEAVARAGSQSAFARMCGVTQPSVWKWLQSGKRLPAEHVLLVEAETGVSRHHLRPDLYPHEIPAARFRTGKPLAADRRGVACDQRGISQGDAA